MYYILSNVMLLNAKYLTWGNKKDIKKTSLLIWGYRAKSKMKTRKITYIKDLKFEFKN